MTVPLTQFLSRNIETLSLYDSKVAIHDKTMYTNSRCFCWHVVLTVGWKRDIPVNRRT